jgi:hypothetical protein
VRLTSCFFIPGFSKNISNVDHGITALLAGFQSRQHKAILKDAFINRRSLMKTILVRTLALVLLATSLTGFASARESKHHDGNTAAQQQNGCAGAAEEGKKQKKENKTGDRSEQEQEFDRVLMGIYG